MLKQNFAHSHGLKYVQPPLGGCVLKQALPEKKQPLYEPAAFRRLCVETLYQQLQEMKAAASRL